MRLIQGVTRLAWTLVKTKLLFMATKEASRFIDRKIRGRPVTPAISVDVICELPGDRICLIERKFPPHGWALPGGFVEVGETLEHAALRELFEETNLRAEIVRQFHAYSQPSRDNRGHTVSVVFLARADGQPRGGDDAKSATAISKTDLFNRGFTFDHREILEDYIHGRF